MKKTVAISALIWDKAKHNALTDLIFFEGFWYLTFRESDCHAGGRDGEIRILQSKNCQKWTSVSLLKLKNVDLRDPKFSITPEKKLMLLVGGSKYSKNGKFTSSRPHVSFSKNGKTWQPFQKILKLNHWLWRLTWLKERGYGVAYDTSKSEKKALKLFATTDGIKYQLIATWKIPGKPNETTLRFDKKDNMIALIRRNGKKGASAFIGFSRPPYTKWSFKKTKHHIGGPNFVILPDGQLIACGRVLNRTPYGYFEKTALFSMSKAKLTPKCYLPSGGVDCSYPGLAYKNDYLCISYYSSHEKKTAIYFCKISLNKLRCYGVIK